LEHHRRQLLAKKWGLTSLKALEFEKWGLKPSSLTKVYAYGYCLKLLKNYTKDSVTHIEY